MMFFHNDGKNVLGDATNVGHIFTAVDAVRGLPDYDKVCADSLYVDPETNQTDCRVWGVTKFWNNTVDLFQEDSDALITMSAPSFPDGSRVPEEDIYGYPDRNDDGNLTYVQSYLVVIELPDTDAAHDFEKPAIDVVLELDDKFHADSSIEFRVEIAAYRSFEDE